MNNQIKKNDTINVLWLGIASFLNDVSSEMIMPILPQIITSVGGTGFALGLIGGLRDSASELLKGFFGRLSDRVSNRKFFIYSGYLTSAFFKLLLLFANTWYFIFGLVGLERLGKAVRTSPRDALITQILPNTVGKGFGIHRTFDTLGGIVGSLLVFYLVWELNTSITFIIILAALLSFISIFPLIPVVEIETPPTPQTKLQLSDFSPQFKTFTAIATLFSLSRVSYMFFIVDAQQILTTISPLKTAMLLFVLFYVFYTVCSIPCGILSDKIGRWKMLVAGYALFAVTLFGFMLATTLPIFICCFITYGIALAIIQVTHKAYASDLSPSHLKATSLGVFESITGLALFGSGILTGILWDILPHALVFMLTGILALTASALMMVLKKRLFIDTNLQAAAQ